MNNIVFKAKSSEFNGVPGYILRLYIDNVLVFERFAAEPTVSLIRKILKFLCEIE